MHDQYRAEARKFKEMSRGGSNVHRRSFRSIRHLFLVLSGVPGQRRTPVKTMR
jgi:hypothetical protein